MRTSSKVAGAIAWGASLLTAASTLFAQEELPSPAAPARQATPATPKPKAAPKPAQVAPLPPDAVPADRAAIRTQRRERLRVIGAQALDAFLPPDGSGPAGVDGARIGAAVRPLAQALLGDGMIETLKIKIDQAGTNLREDRVKLDTIADLRHTPWSDGQSKFASQLSADGR